MSEPQHINEVLPGVLENIERRCNRYRAEHGLPSLEEVIRGDNEHTDRIVLAGTTGRFFK